MSGTPNCSIVQYNKRIINNRIKELLHTARRLGIHVENELINFQLCKICVNNFPSVVKKNFLHWEIISYFAICRITMKTVK